MREDDWDEVEARIKRNVEAQRERDLREEQRKHAALAKAIADEFEKRGFVRYEIGETHEDL